MLRALRRVTGPVQRLVERGVIARTYLQPADALSDAGRFAEADDVLTRGLEAFPDDLVLLTRSAQAAHRRGLVSLALRRWETAIEANPDSPVCLVGLSATLRARGDTARAREVIKDACARFPDEPQVQAETARVAEICGDVERALETWQTLCRSPARKPEWLQRQVQCLIVLERVDEADRVLDAAIAEHGRNADDAAVRGLLGMRGALAAAREDWPAAVAFWTEFRARFPDDESGWQRLGQIRHHLEIAKAEGDDDAGPGRPEVRAEIETVADDETRALLLGFESIGASCEFGLVQRRYGAEPLGLLRWNTVDLDALSAALATRFDGLGAPEHTEILTAANGEFIVRDRRWGFEMHTWLFAGQADRDGLHAKMCRRVTFLKDKLLADLGAAEKVFVFLSAGTEISALRALHQTLRTVGPVRLLAVQPAAATRGVQGQPGDVVDVCDGLQIGVIGRLGQREDAFWDIAFEDWVSICRTAATSPVVGSGAI